MYVVPRNKVGNVPAMFRRSAGWPFSYASRGQRTIPCDTKVEVLREHTVDAGPEGEAGILGDGLSYV